MRIYVLNSTYPDNEDHAEEYLAKLEYDARKVDGFQRLRLVDLHGGISIPGFAHRMASIGWSILRVIPLWRTPSHAKSRSTSGVTALEDRVPIEARQALIGGNPDA